MLIALDDGSALYSFWCVYSLLGQNEFIQDYTLQCPNGREFDFR